MRVLVFAHVPPPFHGQSYMVKLMLDLDTPATPRVLADLVEREILVKTSKSQRGPGVTYGPGPRFAQQRSGRPRKASPHGDAR